ncbi:MAG: UDP-N-acetylmuramoyl-L-alanine--D-glutamate ligase [Patescibacteria group bacterium]
MAPYEPFFKGKRITILGLGLLGRAVGDAEFLAQLGAQIVVTDTKPEHELQESVERLKKYSNITFHLGGHTKDDFTDCDMVIKAAGVRLDSPEVAVARAAGVPVYMSTALAAKFASEAGAMIVGVTGTRGKSTVAHMIHHALISARRRAHLGGNIRGVSTLAILPEVKRGDTFVLELDSWQLQGFGTFEMSPHIAVFTNLKQDHVNYYPNEAVYFADKANIFKYQKPADYLVAGDSIARRIYEVKPHSQVVSATPIPSEWKLQVQGEHNRENAAFAACALKALGLSKREIKDGLESFAGVEGRLQFLREVNGVKVYNDNNATTPEATIVALHALKNDRDRNSIILIMGGADKGLDMRELVSEINRVCRIVVFLAGSGTERFLQAESQKLKATHHGPFNSLDQAFNKALDLAKEGDTILFSPTFASFGLFKNEYDRNDQFLKIVNAL